MNELIIKDSAIQVKKAEIVFKDFEKYKAQAEEIAKYISSIEVTEENVKETKKTIAAAKKVVNGLNRRRIDIKRAILESYDEFETQIKELSDIIDQADAKVRSQVNELEEKERLQKKNQLFAIFQKRAPLYPVVDMIDDCFNRWLEPRHLNKTANIKNVEQDMTNWLEEVQQGYDIIQKMDDSEDILVAYFETLDMTQALAIAQERKAIKERVKEVEEQDDELEDTSTFLIVGKANINLARRLLSENGIPFLETFKKEEH